MDTATRLRQYLGEAIPSQGTDSDTFFSDDDIQDLLINFQGPFAGMNEGLYLAASEGWERKAADASNQADHDQGGSKDSLSQLAKQAADMADRMRQRAYDRQTTRVAQIRRPGTTTY
jgi:hypothetical protein